MFRYGTLARSELLGATIGALGALGIFGALGTTDPNLQPLTLIRPVQAFQASQAAQTGPQDAQTGPPGRPSCWDGLQECSCRHCAYQQTMAGTTSRIAPVDKACLRLLKVFIGLYRFL